MEQAKQDYRGLYEQIVKSEWFKKAYHNKSLGECPIVVEELEESEDERIRKEIIHTVTGYHPVHSTKETNEMVAWLEKQKPIQPNIEREYIEERLRGLLDKEGEYYRGAREELAHLFYILGGEPSQYLINNVAKEEQKPAEWSEEDEIRLKETLGLLDEVEDYLNSKHLGFCKDLEYVRNWLKSLRPQPHWKPSKEEIDAFENLLKGEFPNKIFPGTTLANLLNKLKKLYYNEAIQVWKPSEEQMRVLLDATNPYYLLGDGSRETLKSLYEELKDLSHE